MKKKFTLDGLIIIAAVILVAVFWACTIDYVKDYKLRKAEEHYTERVTDSIRVSSYVVKKVHQIMDTSYSRLETYTDSLEQYTSALEKVMWADARLIEQEAMIIDYIQNTDADPSVAEAMFIKARKLVLDRQKLKEKLKL